MSAFAKTMSGALVPLGELLSGAAFKARPGDATVPLPDRLDGRTVLVLALARDRAATLPVRFESGGARRLAESRQYSLRQPGDLARALRGDATGVGAEWVVVVMTLGWQVQIGSRAARQAGDEPFERFRMLRDQPELLVNQAKPDHVYAAVDHPLMDRSVLFSCRRKEVDDALAEVGEAGLKAACVRLGVASQVEHWLATQREKAIERDLLVTDGMSVLMINAYDGDLLSVGRQGREGDPVPRQASARPAEVPRDIARFLRDNGNRPVRFLGPAELLPTIESGPDGAPTDMRSDDLSVSDAVMAALSPHVFHDLNPGLAPERKALPGHLRRWVWVGFGVQLVLAAAVVAGLWAGFSAGLKSQQERRVIGQLHAEIAAAGRECDAMHADLRRAEAMRAWIGANYHAQSLVHRILASLPTGVAIESLTARLDEGSPQMSLEFVLLGSEEAQVAAARALERAVLRMEFQIGERTAPVQVPGGKGYRWRLLMPAFSREGQGV